MAISDDTLVIGAPGESGAGGNSSGAAYVYVRSGDSWVQQAYLKASNAGPGDRFGSSVAISGNTLVVGAPDEDGDSPYPAVQLAYGAAYVFVRSGSVWSQQAYLRASNADQYDEFGASVAISGDDIVIGAPYANGSGFLENPPFNVDDFGAGAAYVFTRNDSNFWVQQASLKAAVPVNSGYYTSMGRSVAISGDTLVSGGYVFVRSETSWNLQANLKPVTSEPDDGFGASVSISGETIVVGAPNEDGENNEFNQYSQAGAAHVFERTGATWSPTAHLRAFNQKGHHQFGSSVAIYNNTIVVGAPDEWGSGKGLNPVSDEEANYAGAAYAFRRKNNAWNLLSYLKASNTGDYDYFGTGVAISGDSIVLGAPEEDGGGKGLNPSFNEQIHKAGAAYLFAIPKLRQLILTPEISVVSPKGRPVEDNITVSMGRAVFRKGSLTKTFRIWNTGNIPLNLAGIRKSGPHASEFHIVDYKYISDYKEPLAPGASLPVEITFWPKAKGIRKATFRISSNDADESSFELKVSGIGVKTLLPAQPFQGTTRAR